MTGFTNKQLKLSLVFPLLTMGWGVIYSVNDLLWGAYFLKPGIFRISYFIAIIMGGILPIILTLTLRIHTEQYIKNRLIVFAFICVAEGFIGKIGIPLITFIFLMFFDIGAIIYQIVRVQDDDTIISERVILILSDPIVYRAIYWFIFYLERGFEIE